MSDQEKPNFYAIIPANVRYDKELTPNAKLFYGEISSILNFNNKCYASNSYFARVFNISEVQVSRIIKQLSKKNYISVEYINSEKGTKRFIALNINVNPPLNINDKGGVNINVKHNSNNTNNSISTNVDNTRAKKSNNKKEFIKPTLQEVKDYFKEKGYKEEAAIRSFEYYEAGEWKDGKGNKVRNWKQKMLSVWMKEENKIVEQNSEQGKIIF